MAVITVRHSCRPPYQTYEGDMDATYHRTVYQRADRNWVNASASGQVSSIHLTKSEAVAIAKQMIREYGGGWLTVKNADGTLLSDAAINVKRVRGTAKAGC